jgi:small subunit ribosomal protein S2
MSGNNKQLSLIDLFKVGAHRGNSKSKLNPRLKKYIYGVENGLCLIDLVETKNSIDTVEAFMKKLGQRKKQVLLVGTSKHLQEAVSEFAKDFAGGEMPYINNRWLGGTLTNWATIRKTLKTLEKLENIVSNKSFFDKLSRNEQLNMQREVKKLSKFFGGLKTLKNNRPGAVLVLDSNSNAVAIKEADVVKVPVVALSNVNTKILPKSIDNVIVTNTNSTNTVDLILKRLINSYNEGFENALPVKKEVSEEEKAKTKKEEVKEKA